MTGWIKSIFKDRRGLALPLTVALIAIVSLLGVTAAYLVDSQGVMASRHKRGQDALFYAEAGVNEYLWRLNKNSKFYEEDDHYILDGGNPRVHAHRDGFFQLRVTPPDTQQPVVTITSTGWAAADPGNRRTVRVQAHKRQFVQTIYLTGGENTPSGTKVWWITGDEVWGPLHTNGTLHIDGDPVFHGPVTYSGGLEVRSGSNPVYEQGISQVSQLGFPASNNQLKIQAQLNGYYYNGRTCILLDGDQLRISHRAGSPVTRPLPPNSVIYVDGTSGDKFGLDTGNVFVSGTLNGRLTIASANDIYITARNPAAFNFDTAAVTGGIRYSDNDFDPSDGDITDDMLGLVSARFIRILHYDWPDNSTDRRTRYYADEGDVAPGDITIQAALFALNQCFEFEDYNEGSRKGSIYFTGSMSQKFRGAVGTFSSWTGSRLTGYSKNYSHDPRMRYDSPPHFLEPTNAGWEIVSWREAANP